jgi:hypothetical protein
MSRRRLRDEGINRLLGPSGRVLRHGRALRLHKRPVRFVLSTLKNPLAKGIDFGGVERVAMVGRRHHFVRISARDAAHDFAFVGSARHDATDAIFLAQCSFHGIEPEIPFAVTRIGTVATDAVFRKEGTHLVVEAHCSAYVGGEHPEEEPNAE